MSNSFPVVPAPETGYNRQEVDDFIARARNSYSGVDNSVTLEVLEEIAFDEEIGGYEFDAVDAALDRLEDGFRVKFGEGAQSAAATQAMPMAAATQAMPVSAPTTQKHEVQNQAVPQVKLENKAPAPLNLQNPAPVQPPVVKPSQNQDATAAISLPQTVITPSSSEKNEGEKKFGLSLPTLKKSKKAKEQEKKLISETGQSEAAGKDSVDMKVAGKGEKPKEQPQQQKAQEKKQKSKSQNSQAEDIKVKSASKKEEAKSKKQDSKTEPKSFKVQSDPTLTDKKNILKQNKNALAAKKNEELDDLISGSKSPVSQEASNKTSQASQSAVTKETLDPAVRVPEVNKKRKAEPIQAEKASIGRTDALNALVQNVQSRRQQQLPPTPEIKPFEAPQQVSTGSKVAAAGAGVAGAAAVTGIAGERKEKTSSQKQSTPPSKNRAKELASVMDAIQTRMDLGPGKRFRKAQKSGYSIIEVDDFSTKIERYLEEREELTVEDVQDAKFSTASTLDAYSEAQVDALLDRLTEIIQAS